jgi:hypothetical protein
MVLIQSNQKSRQKKASQHRPLPFDPLFCQATARSLPVLKSYKSRLIEQKKGDELIHRPMYIAKRLPIFPAEFFDY